MDVQGVLKRGLCNGLDVVKVLGKVLVPVIFLVTFLEHSGWLPRIAELTAPLMDLFGLPGEAALVLVVGNLTNVFGALGAMMTMELTAREVTILGVMVTISHSLPSETVVISKAGAHGKWALLYRLLASIFFGILLNVLI